MVLGLFSTTSLPVAKITFNKSLAVADMRERLAIIDTGRKVGVLRPFLEGAGFPSNTMSPGPRHTFVPSGILIHPAVWPQQPWPKIAGLCPFVRSYSTMWRVPMPTSMPSFILIHPTIWSQYTNVTDRQDSGQHRARRFTNGRPNPKTTEGH